MARSLLLGLLFFIFQSRTFLADDVTGPPSVESFKAVGEITGKLSDDDKIFQSHFDETYDNGTGNAAFIDSEFGVSVSFIEDGITGQTFKYCPNCDEECTLETVVDWITDSGPSLVGYESHGGKIKFSLRQLFQLPNSYLVAEAAGQSTTWREIPAVSWQYNIKSKTTDKGSEVLDIYAYWSEESWTSTSRFGQPIPLGFLITRLIHDTENKNIGHIETHINVLGFVHGVVDQIVFEPRQMVQCKNRTKIFSFPEVSKAKTFSLKSEIVLPDYKEAKTMDVWYDAKNGMLRVDLDPLKGQDVNFKGLRGYQSKITSKKLGATFSFNFNKGVLTCKAFGTQQYEMDYQEIINPKLDIKLWSFDYLFGRNTTDFSYIGKTTKRNIPCHLFQGVRNDWLDQKPGTIALWEWCVAADLGADFEEINFRDKEIGLISAQVKILNDTTKTGFNGFKMIHHFYDVIEEDPAALDVSFFDISRCFNNDQKSNLQFIVDQKITTVELKAVENATYDVNFLSAWKSAISDKAGIPEGSMRVARVQTMVLGDKLYVSFVLLDIHPDLTKEIKDNQPSLKTAYDSLKSAIDNGKLEIKYALATKTPVSVKALKNTLKDVVADPISVVGGDPTSAPVTFPTKTTSKFTLRPFTIVPPDTDATDKEKATTTDTPKPSETPVTDKPIQYEGHGSGAVAGASIAMLLIGFTAGAGGTFYKIKGRPSFL